MIIIIIMTARNCGGLSDVHVVVHCQSIGNIEENLVMFDKLTTMNPVI